MKWIKVKEESPPDELRVQFCDKTGFQTFGTWQQGEYTDDHGSEIYDVVLWAYIEDPPYEPSFGIITHPDWIDAINKAGRFR